MSTLSVHLHGGDRVSRRRTQRQRTAAFFFIAALIVLLSQMRDRATGGPSNRTITTGTETSGPIETVTETNGRTDTGTQTIDRTDTGMPTNGATETGAPTNGTTGTGPTTIGTNDTGTETTGTTDTGTETTGTTDTGTETTGTTVTSTETEVAPPLEARLEIIPPRTTHSMILRQSASPAPVIVINTGPMAVRIASIVSSNPAFAIGSDDCTGRDLGPGERCGVELVFSPVQRGPVSGQWTITDDTQKQHVVEFTGNGLLRRLVIAPESVAFGSMLLDSMGLRDVEISNDGDVDVALDSVSIDPENTPFSIYAREDPCRPGPIAPGQSCKAIVRFVGNMVGEFHARVIVRGTGGVEEASAPVSASVSTRQRRLGKLLAVPSRVLVRKSTADVAVNNIGDGPVLIEHCRLEFAPDEEPWLEITENTCTGTIPPRGSCSVTVQMQRRRPKNPAHLIFDLDRAASRTLDVEFVPPLPPVKWPSRTPQSASRRLR